MTLRLARSNLADSAIISAAASTITSLPPANLKEPDIQRIWRSGGSTGDALIIDLGGQETFGMVALVNTNLDDDDTIHVRVSTSDPTGQDGNAYNSGVFAAAVDPAFSMFVHFIEPAVTGRYIRIGATVSNSPWEAGRLVVAPTWEPSRHFSFGWEQGRQDHSRRAFSLGMNLLIDRLPRQKLWRFTLFGLTEAEVDDEIEPLNRLNGASQDIFICRDMTASNLGKVSIWGLLDEPVTYSQIRETQLFEAEFLIRARI